MKKTNYRIGLYQLGFRPVELFLSEELQGGMVDLIPTKFSQPSGVTQIFVGLYAPYEVVLATLLHEIYELSLIDLNTRYSPDPSFSNESSDYIFVMTHNQLGEAHDRIGAFLSQALTDFSKMYKKYSRS